MWSKRALIAATAALVMALPLVAEAQGQGDPNNSCQVSTAQPSGNGVPVRSKVDSTCHGGACGAASTVPAGTKGCAYRFDGNLVWVSMPVINAFGVSTQDRVYLADQITGANN